MTDADLQSLVPLLACPQCGSASLSSPVRASAFACAGCRASFPRSPSGALDLRPQRPRTLSQAFEIDPCPDRAFAASVQPLPMHAEPEVDFSGMQPPPHLTRALLSHFPSADHPGQPMLDIGCGDGAHRPVCEHAGFRYVGLDYDSAKADILADAHLLPFRDQTFQFVISIAVLHYLHFPLQAMREVYRVLKPGGVFIGNVAFLEPFHGTLYHHTHWGTEHSLRQGGLEVRHLGPTPDWPVLTAQAEMGLFPRMPPILPRAIVAPVQWLHRLWWAAGGLIREGANEAIRRSNTAGSFDFVAYRPR
ncbi:class I SAM-dependent methyltransferase [uncultured Thiohalocapsa sp.]|uniref:class I SAM-dependent methyltransferase n=1 Tax=uncultured Thiohalocapsa sp. TaxID=768990 RepID=UPI0025DCA039|nr:class I SAM-dependent methyltransferase [uncultured Thiohalocapsa sp.]